MNTVITLYDRPDEWYQDTYICCECSAEFMIDFSGHPRFCPCCGVKFNAVRIKYPDRGERMETIFLKDEEVKPIYCNTDSLKVADKMKIKQILNGEFGKVVNSDKEENKDV